MSCLPLFKMLVIAACWNRKLIDLKLLPLSWIYLKHSLFHSYQNDPRHLLSILAPKSFLLSIKKHITFEPYIIETSDHLRWSVLISRSKGKKSSKVKVRQKYKIDLYTFYLFFFSQRYIGKHFIHLIETNIGYSIDR